jgi:hypothetical protein
VVFPSDQGIRINRVFFDLKSPSAPWKFMRDNWAKTLLVDYNFNGIRTSIYGTAGKLAHPAPGVVIEKFYKPETQALKLAKKLRPDTLIFASKKLEGTDSFPDWTKDHDGVLPENYAVLLADYLDYMQREGLPVDVLGIDNERRYNEGNLTPERHREVVEALRILAQQRGFKMPQIIGHEDFAMGRNHWMETFKKTGGDTLDIFGGHYYPGARYLDRLRSDLKAAGTREKWHTELHWDSRSDGDPFLLATQACLALWDCTDNGMNGLMWWDFSSSKTMRNELMHAVTIPLVNARPVAVRDPDGALTVDEMALHTRAFLQGDRLTVYAINLDPSRDWDLLDFKLANGKFEGQVEQRQWADGLPAEGQASLLEPRTSRTFRAEISPRTIHVFTVKISL